MQKVSLQPFLAFCLPTDTLTLDCSLYKHSESIYIGCAINNVGFCKAELNLLGCKNNGMSGDVLSFVCYQNTKHIGEERLYSLEEVLHNIQYLGTLGIILKQENTQNKVH